MYLSVVGSSSHHGTGAMWSIEVLHGIEADSFVESSKMTGKAQE